MAKPDRRHFRGRKKPLRVATSWDDGHEDDRIIQRVLDQLGFKGTFYIPSYTPLPHEYIRLLAEKHEIGGHTVSHPPDLKLLTYPDLVGEIKDNKEFLEGIIGKPITKFCYPKGRYNEQVIEVLKQVGFTEARTTIVLKTQVEDPFRTPTSVHVFQRQEYNGKTWIEMAKLMCEQASKDGGTFHLWGHSWEVMKLNQLSNLTEFLYYLKENYETVNN